jgi:hypothetical protein
MGIEVIEIKFVEKEQDWVNETTRYWFDVGGDKYCIADQNGEFTLLDSDGCPTLNSRADQYLFKALMVKLSKIVDGPTL